MEVNVRIDKRKRCGNDNSLYLSFPYNEIIIKNIRSLSTRYWHANSKEWEVPYSKLDTVLNFLQPFKINITFNSSLLKGIATLSEIPKDYVFKTKPYQHQIDGVNYALSHGSFLLGDDPGLGKTKSIIDTTQCLKRQKHLKHCLVICCVNGNKYNWKEEIGIHSNDSGYILGSRITKRGKFKIGSNEDKLYDLEHLPKDFYIITNIETLRYKIGEKVTLRSGRTKTVYKFPIVDKLKELIRSGKISYIAVDEVHLGCNPTSQQGKALMELKDAGDAIWVPMTGTPIRNKPLDVYLPLYLIGKEDHSFYQFKQHYCIMGGFGGSTITGYKNMSELQETVDEVMLRRLKKDVLDLPEKIQITEYVEMTSKQSKLYNDVLDQIRADIDKVRLSPDPLSQLLRLRQVTGNPTILSSVVTDSPKYDRMEQLIADLVEEGEKALVFSNWTSVINPAYERLKLGGFNPALYTGENVKERESEKFRFQNDPNCKVICGTIGAMGTGITLTAGTTVIFLDEPWTRSSKDQAEDRAYRIGTTKNVNIITIIAVNTIDEKIHNLVYRKGKMSDIIIDKEADLKITPNILNFLLAS